MKTIVTTAALLILMQIPAFAEVLSKEPAPGTLAAGQTVQYKSKQCKSGVMNVTGARTSRKSGSVVTPRAYACAP